MKVHSDLHVEHLMFLSHFNQIWNLSADFYEGLSIKFNGNYISRG